MNLFERDEYFQTLRNGFGKTLAGEGNSILILGEAGIGKSSLVRNFLEEVRGKGQVFMALCDSLFTPRPLGVLYDLAQQIDPALASRINTTTQRTELFADFVKALTDYHKPVVLVIEDIHWADEASLDFIKYVARRITQTPCLFMLTYRDDEITLQHPLRNVLGELPPGTFTRIALPPLSRETVQTLANEKGYSGEDVYAVTGGNPFYVNEVLASYSQGVPENIKDAVLALYNRQKESTRRMWELLAIMPEGLEYSWLDKIDPQWQEAIDLCLTSGILLFRNNRIVFKHELFRRTIEESLSPFKRLELNKKVLELFSDSFEKSGAIERIVHYAKNGALNNIVIQYAPLAAKQAAAFGSHVEAAKLYLAAIEYNTSKNNNDLVQLYEAYTYECYLTNQIKEAIFYQTKALHIWQAINNQEQTGNSLRFLSRLWWYNGHQKEAKLYGTQAIELFEDLPSSKAKAMAYSNLSQLYMLSENVEDAIDWGNKAIAIAAAIGDEEIRSHALNNIGTVKMKVAGLIAEGKKQLLESLQIALQNSLDEHAARAYTNLISNSVTHKEYNTAEKYLEEGLQYCGERDLHSWASYNMMWKARMLLERGNWEAAAELAGNHLSNPVQPGIVRIGAITVRGIIKVRRGEEDGLVLLKEAKELAFLTEEHQRIVPVVIALLEYEWLSGNKVLSDEELAIAQALIAQVDNMWLNSEAVFWMEKARSVQLELPVLYEPYKLLHEGKAAEAAAFWQTKGCTYERAFALFSGNEEQKREALNLLQTLHADATYQKLKSEMRSSGIRSIPRGLRSSTISNPAQLTTRELDILQLLKTGASNKEIATSLYISPKTVDHHISSILFKLDVPSRAKAVGEAAKRGILK
ncbi:MAG TPA: AAA family ATPase [Parafilimonas sp.]|nr:AAA family ATPase [Parafilimonas sp.]